MGTALPALLGFWADVGAAPGHGEDETFCPEGLYRARHRVPAHAVLLLELLHGRQGGKYERGRCPALSQEAQWRTSRALASRATRGRHAELPGPS
jgi:hypothetical protein